MIVRILLGVSDRDLAAALSAQVNELADIEIVGVETTSVDVVGAAQTVSPLDVVLVHQNLGPLPAFDLVRELAAGHPQLAVILIAEQATAETFSAAMSAGARGVISSEPTLSELQNRIGTAAEWSRTMRRHFDSSYTSQPAGRLGTLLALCGAKGGTGTTMLAVQLAVAVAAAKRSVCLVDMDLQKGDVASYLDVRHRRSIADLVAAASDMDGTILAEALYIHRSGPHILLAPADGEQSEDVPARATRQILGTLRSRYDVVIVDCGAHMSEGNAMAVELADNVIITATPDLPCLRAAKRLAKLWGRLQIRKEDDLAVLLNRQDKRNEVQPDFARKVLGLPLLRTTIPASFRALEEAANTGSPTAVSNGDFRKAVGALTREAGLIAEQQPPSPIPPPHDQGVAVVEFAAILPLIGLLLLLVWQAVLVGLTSMYSSHAANEGARAVAVLGYDTPDARAEVRRRAVARISGPWGDPNHLQVAVENGYMRVTIDAPAVLPGLRTPFGITTHAKIVDEVGP